MKSNREKLINYVKNGGEKFLFAPAIGANGGFETKLAGKTWISQTTLEDTKAACRRFNAIPLYRKWPYGVYDLTDSFQFEHRTEALGAGYNHISTLKTPVGSRVFRYIETEFIGDNPVEYYVKDEEDLDILEYVLDALLEVNDFSLITEDIKKFRAQIGEEETMMVIWASHQPYELLNFPDNVACAILATTERERYIHLMDKVLALNEKIIPAVAKGGADFIGITGPGSEMISPQYYKDFIVPYSKQVSDMAHDAGCLLYAHFCAKIEPMLSMGYYNQMGIDFFETLSEAPVGNVASIADAFEKISPTICTRGNIDLGAMQNETPEQIYERSMKILETAKRMGRKHILSATDFFMYDTKEENVQAMCRAVRDFNGE